MNGGRLEEIDLGLAGAHAGIEAEAAARAVAVAATRDEATAALAAEAAAREAVSKGPAAR